MTALTEGGSISVQAVGIAQAGLMLLSLTRRKAAVRKPIAEFQAIQFMIAEWLQNHRAKPGTPRPG